VSILTHLNIVFVIEIDHCLFDFAVETECENERGSAHMLWCIRFGRSRCNWFR